MNVKEWFYIYEYPSQKRGGLLHLLFHLGRILSHIVGIKSLPFLRNRRKSPPSPPSCDLTRFWVPNQICQVLSKWVKPMFAEDIPIMWGWTWLFHLPKPLIFQMLHPTLKCLHWLAFTLHIMSSPVGLYPTHNAFTGGWAFVFCKTLMCKGPV